MAHKKAQTDYWVLKTTWNRRILYGPFLTQSRFDEFVLDQSNKPHTMGGPVSFFLLKAVKGARVVRRTGGLVGIERTPDGQVQSKKTLLDYVKSKKPGRGVK